MNALRGYLASVRPSYRVGRRCGFSPATAARHALTPTRLSIAWAALHGRPVAYRIQMVDGAIVVRDGLYLAECRYKWTAARDVA